MSHEIGESNLSGVRVRGMEKFEKIGEGGHVGVWYLGSSDAVESSRLSTTAEANVERFLADREEGALVRLLMRGSNLLTAADF